VVKTASKGAENAGAEVTIVNLRDYPMPIYNPDDHQTNGFDENALRFQELLARHDGFLIASPVCNGSFSAALKNVIDRASRQNDRFQISEVFRGRAAAIMTTSPGSFGGLRTLAHLRAVLTSVNLIVLPQEVAAPYVEDKFTGGAEEMVDERMKVVLESPEASLAEFLWKTGFGVST
jgi:NAD(P)H-dependent FMN reductase